MFSNFTSLSMWKCRLMYNNYRLKDRYRMWKTNKNVSFSHCLWLFLSSSEFQANKEREQKSFRISNSVSGHNWLAHPPYRITAGKEILSVGFMELGFLSYFLLGFLGGSAVKNLPTMQKLQETWVRSLGGEDPLEDGMATHSIFLPGESVDRGTWWATALRVAKSQTQLKWLRTHTYFLLKCHTEGLLLLIG